MDHSKSIHFVGIGGIGMSGIAQILLSLGYAVSGSDITENLQTEKLKSLGAKIFRGHHESHVGHVDMLVISSAIAPNNPEILEAKNRNIPIMSRAQMLSELMRKKQSIAIAGAHGKTTTSAMITTLLLESGFDPTAVIGGRLKQIAGNAKIGTDNWFIAESDESDGSFLHLLPTFAVITNLDQEHLDHYGTYQKLEQAFVDFANRVPFDGAVIVCNDDPGVRAILPLIEKPIISYGINLNAEVQATDIVLTESGATFVLNNHKTFVCRIVLNVTGLHNVYNALASAALGLCLNISDKNISKGLSAFSGIGRRLEHVATYNHIRIVDDYAHHPTEIRVSLEALHHYCDHEQGQIRVLFQPHRFSRVGNLWDQFVTAFDRADEVFILPIYAASERPLVGIDSQNLVLAIAKRDKTKVHFVGSLEEGAQAICQSSKRGDVLVTMGAGDVTKASMTMSKILQERKQS